MNVINGAAAECRSPQSHLERIFLHLTDGWALGYDQHQWMLLRARNLRSQRKWQPVAYVGSTKCILRRVLYENGVYPNPEVAEYLNTMPETFREWHRCYQVA